MVFDYFIFWLKYDWGKVCIGKIASASAADVEICEVKSECRLSKTKTIIEWFRRFTNGETSLEDQPRSGRLLIDYEH